MHQAALRRGDGCGVPSVEEVAGFVAACRDAGATFKATAGLHHPARGVEAASGLTMHGFLSLLGACCLAERDPAAFALDAESFAVHGRRFAAHEIAGVRRALFHGQGRCSFSEPVEDLRTLGMLPA